MFDLKNLAIWVGLLGGFSGFVALFLQGWSTYISSPRVKVNLTFAINPSDGRKYYSIDVVNSGGRPITINTIGIRYENRMHSPFTMYPNSDRIGNNFPFRLDSHSSQCWLVGEESTKSGILEMKVLPEIQAYLQLATGKEKVSEVLSIIN